MDAIAKVKLTYVVFITLTSILSALFFAYNPARKREGMAIALNYYSLFFLFFAFSFIIYVIRPSMNNISFILLNNLTTIIAFHCLYNGFLWRNGIKKHLYKKPWAWIQITMYAFIQIFMLTIAYDSFQLRVLHSGIIYIVFFILIYKVVSLDITKNIFGERVMRIGIISSAMSLILYLLFLSFTGKNNPQMISYVLTIQGLMIFILFGSISSLILSDIVEVFKKISITDSMTGLYNRRYFLERCSAALRDADRSGNSTAFIICDIDLFKNINDTHGHDIGDKAICGFSDLIKGLVRGNDVVARYGGEEFVILLSNTEKEGALVLAEKIRSELESYPIEISSSKSIEFTASFGVSVTKNYLDLEGLIKNADNALYRAKENGRNRVESL